MAKHIKYGMVGGDLRAFIGEVHRKALNFDTRAELVAGCFSIDRDLNIQTAEAYCVDASRVYFDYKDMAAKEAARPDPIDFVVIVTPNHLHFEIAKTFLEAGINVVCEKPLCFEIAEANELKRLTEENGLVFGVTYTYTGYAMSKVMKEMIQNGAIGDIVTVNAEYAQEWLIDELGTKNDGTAKLSVWRTDPKFSGISNCVGDIGTHIESMVHYLTGLEIKRLLATTNNYGHPLDLNANIIVEYDNGANGAYWCSQVAAGKLNGLVVRIYGSEGSLEWEQHHPDYVRYTPKGQAPRILSRGCGYLTGAAADYSRIPSGHPEGLIIGFANIYKNIITAIEAQKAGQVPTGAAFDYPSVDSGVDGVKFVHAVIDSAKNNAAWVDLK
ncbi:MAG: Gfo/Idh/MocA family oxidoreductase [Oscillospiraceae bacterium]|nr:Gfo/Idh/MocA family oxidoreductase [Oscillospiraceae bacterium]